MFVVAPILCVERGVWSLFCGVVFGVLSSLAIVLLRTTLLCVVAVCVPCLDIFLTVPWAGPQSVIVAFSSPSHLL